jgi:hypothetical protein
VDQRVRPVNTESKNTVEIVVHITEELNEDRRNALIATLDNTAGIAKSEFCRSRHHLMLVKYETQTCSSQDVLGRITAQEVHAQLIGPM